ncbi:hypothetical protein HDV00_000417 [Rhizophlyctis rosea]|nr:hypothetical protein HDV00_000417 [Rhizophlyctis rosea]
MPLRRLLAPIKNHPLRRVLTETDLNWQLAPKDPVEREAFFRYLAIHGLRRLRFTSGIASTLYLLYVVSQIAAPRSRDRLIRLGVTSAQLAICIACFISTKIEKTKSYWYSLTLFMVSTMFFTNIVIYDIMNAILTGAHVGPPMEDLQSHVTLASTLFFREIHPGIISHIGGTCLLIREILAPIMYHDENIDNVHEVEWRIVVTMGISLSSTYLTAVVSLYIHRIYELWIFHQCRTHNIDLRILDVRAQYDESIRQSYRDLRESEASLGSSTGGLPPPPRSKLRKWWKLIRLEWDDAEIERRNRILQYQMGFPLVVLYLTAMLIKHLIDSAINKRWTKLPSFIGEAFAGAIVILLLYNLIRPFRHKILYHIYCTYLMLALLFICYCYLLEGSPYFTKCCSKNALATQPPEKLWDARASVYTFVSPVATLMFASGTLFRLPFWYQAVFAGMIPHSVWATIETSGLFWMFNFVLCAIFSIGLAYNVELQQWREVRLQMVLSALTLRSRKTTGGGGTTTGTMGRIGGTVGRVGGAIGKGEKDLGAAARAVERSEVIDEDIELEDGRRGGGVGDGQDRMTGHGEDDPGDARLGNGMHDGEVGKGNRSEATEKGQEEEAAAEKVSDEEEGSDAERTLENGEVKGSLPNVPLDITLNRIGDLENG